jgi:hypothetical protein
MGYANPVVHLQYPVVPYPSYALKGTLTRIAQRKANFKLSINNPH